MKSWRDPTTTFPVLFRRWRYHQSCKQERKNLHSSTVKYYGKHRVRKTTILYAKFKSIPWSDFVPKYARANLYPFASAGANLKSMSECVSTAAPGKCTLLANDANLDRNLLPLLQTCMHTMLLFRTSFSSSYSLAVLYLQRLCISKETQPITRFPPRKTRAKVDAKTAQYIFLPDLMSAKRAWNRLLCTVLRRI